MTFILVYDDADCPQTPMPIWVDAPESDVNLQCLPEGWRWEEVDDPEPEPSDPGMENAFYGRSDEPDQDAMDLIYGTDEELYECPNGHGNQPVVDTESFTGFAGGRSYAMVLGCGCTILDESDDVRAAE